MGDYRPILVLPAPSKVIERLVYTQLVYYLECNSLLDNRQHGFRRNFSTFSAIMEVTQILFDNEDQGNIVHCVFIDYSKERIKYFYCRKLQNLGFDKQMVNWCQDYLAGRVQCLKIQKSVIFPCHVTRAMSHLSNLRNACVV